MELRSRLFAGIMAGGKGERLWPLSRKNRPKQLLKLFSDKTLIEETVGRIEPLIPKDRMVVITTSELKPQMTEILPDITLLFEPEGKNTAPACAFAASYLKRQGFDDAVLFMLPADHVIQNGQLLRETLLFAAGLADQTKKLVTFGITPSRPETGYGYIEFGDPIAESDGFRAFDVVKFHEKPDLERAKAYIESGRFLWNSGMFVWRVDVFLDSLRRHMPELFDLTEKYDVRDPDELQLFYKDAPKTSIDYGLMEKAENIAVVEARFDWEDIGSFAALDRIITPDANRNVLKGEVIAVESEDNVFVSEGGLIAALGVSELIVVHTKDVTLVIPRKYAQRVKELLAKVREKGKLEYT